MVRIVASMGSLVSLSPAWELVPDEAGRLFDWLSLRAFSFFLFVLSSVASLSRARTFPFPPPGIGGITKAAGLVLGPWMNASIR